MNTFLTILLGIALLGVLVSLGTGFYAMARGGEFNKKYGNRLMRYRVILQGVALLLLALILMSR